MARGAYAWPPPLARVAPARAVRSGQPDFIPSPADSGGRRRRRGLIPSRLHVAGAEGRTRGSRPGVAPGDLHPHAERRPAVSRRRVGLRRARGASACVAARRDAARRGPRHFRPWSRRARTRSRSPSRRRSRRARPDRLSSDAMLLGLRPAMARLAGVAPSSPLLETATLVDAQNSPVADLMNEQDPTPSCAQAARLKGSAMRMTAPELTPSRVTSTSSRRRRHGVRSPRSRADWRGIARITPGSWSARRMRGGCDEARQLARQRGPGRWPVRPWLARGQDGVESRRTEGRVAAPLHGRQPAAATALRPPVPRGARAGIHRIRTRASQSVTAKHDGRAAPMIAIL